jgi:hypothetical protein
MAYYPPPGTVVGISPLLCFSRSGVTTADAIPAVLGTLTTQSANAVQRYTGHVAVRNTSTQESAEWDVTWACKKAGGVCTLFGPVSVALFEADAAIANQAGTLAVPVVTASGNGCQVSAQGLAGMPLVWSFNFVLSVEA